MNYSVNCFSITYWNFALTVGETHRRDPYHFSGPLVACHLPEWLPIESGRDPNGVFAEFAGQNWWEMELKGADRNRRDSIYKWAGHYRESTALFVCCNPGITFRRVLKFVKVRSWSNKTKNRITYAYKEETEKYIFTF